MTEVLNEAGFDPNLLGLNTDKPENAAVIERFAGITRLFQELRLPLFALPKEKADALWPHQEGTTVERPKDWPPDFTYGPDYFFGRYKGHPTTIEQNAQAAMYHGDQGVPVWAVLKSVAYAIPGTDRMVFVHLRGDRKVDGAKVAQLMGFPNLEELPMAEKTQLEALGLESGTVNPLVADSPNIRHVFDRDLVAGNDYPESDLVFTSSGNKSFYVGFDVRKYIQAKYQNHVLRVNDVSEVSEPGPKRLAARRPIFVIGGDSPADAWRYGEIIGRDIVDLLLREDIDQYFGDQSSPKHFRVFSESEIAGSIDTALYGAALQAYIRDIIVPELKRFSSENPNARPLIAYGSFAMEGIAGENILGQVEGIEYVGSRGVVENLLASLRKERVAIAYTLLLGLSSAYDKDRSAFAGKILESVPNVSGSVREKIQTLVQNCKKGKPGTAEKVLLYQAIEGVLRGAEAGNSSAPNLQALKDKTVMVIDSASELENFVSDDWDQIDEPTPVKNQTRPDFLVIRSNDPNVIKEEIRKARATKAQREKIRIVFISPKRAVAETIAQKTLGLVS